MNKHFRSCKKCEKPLKRHALKAVIKNTMMEPSRAWIKNVGAGTSRELPKKHLSRSRLFVKAPIPTLLTDEIYDLTLDDSIDPKGTKGTQNVQRVVKLEKMDKTTHTSANKPIPNVDETVSSVQNDNTQHDDTAINNTIVANVIDQNTLYKTCSENNVSSFGSDEMARTSKENLNGTTINSLDNTITAANQKPSGISVLVNDLNDSNDFKESNTNDITIVSNLKDKLKNVNVRRNTIRSIANTFSPPTPDPYRSRANGSVEDSSVLLNSTEVSETFIKLDRATHFLRNFNNSNGKTLFFLLFDFLFEEIWFSLDLDS